MLKKSLKILSLTLAIASVSGCSNSESNNTKSKISESSKGSEKSVLIECKADEWDKGDKFNATIEIFPMTKEVLNSINFDKKERIKVYAKVKNIEYGSSWKFLKDCQPIAKDSMLFSYTIDSLEDIGKKYEEGLFPKPLEACMQSMSITFEDLTFKKTGVKRKYQSELTREIPNGMDDFKSLSSTCTMKK
jgi:hypothetical protein